MSRFSMSCSLMSKPKIASTGKESSFGRDAIVVSKADPKGRVAGSRSIRCTPDRMQVGRQATLARDTRT